MLRKPGLLLLTILLALHKVSCYNKLQKTVGGSPIGIISNPKAVAEGQGRETIREKRADDLGITAIQSLVQQQAKAIETLQSQVTALQTAVESRVPASKTQVAFSAHFNADSGNDGVHLNAGQILQFDVVTSNIGNGYNGQTGIFTAPVSGLYVFHLNIMSTNAHGSIHVAITKQGTVQERVWAEGSGDAYDQGSGQTAVHLAAGEQVWVKNISGDSIRGYYWTVFMGFLVQAD